MHRILWQEHNSGQGGGNIKSMCARVCVGSNLTS